MGRKATSSGRIAKFRPLMATLLIVAGALSTNIVQPSLAYGLSPSAQFGSPIVVTPDSSGSGNAFKVSCPTANLCITVGFDYATNSQEIYSVGTEAGGAWSWSTSAVIAPDSSGGGELNDLSCPSSTMCIAVGSDTKYLPIYTVGTEAGGSWSWSTSVVVTPDNSGGGSLLDVSCPSTTSCIAIGGDFASPEQEIYTVGTGAGGSWSWSTSSVITPDSSGGGLLDDLSCSTTTSCVAVGDDVAGSPQSIFTAGTESGNTWTWTTSADVVPDSAGLGVLNGIDCASSTSCVAVGNDTGDTAYGQAIFAAGTESGNTWTWTTSTDVAPDSSGGGSFNDVYCTSTTSCIAVGQNSAVTNQGMYSVGTESGNTWAWTTSADVSPDPSGEGELGGVTCPTASICVAVGIGGLGTSPNDGEIIAYSLLTATTLPTAKAPGTVVIDFRLRSSTLNSAEHNALGRLATKLAAGDSVTITGYAIDNGALAKRRAQDVAAYLLAKVKVHVTIKTVTKTAANKVTVTTTKTLTA